MLLTEGAAQPTDIPDHVVVVIKQTAAAYFMVYYGDKDNPDEVAAQAKIRGAPYLGKVRFGKNDNHGIGPCDGAMKIGHSRAQHGWGPMLYDVAMEHATQIANGLIADRDSVSGSARAVWDYYLANRGDVMAHQLDDLKNTLTPKEEDNCHQGVARAKPGVRGRGWQDEDTDQSWVDSPLSKRYTKEPTTINALKAAGKLVIL